MPVNAELYAYLNRDPLKHLVHLKYLHLYPQTVQGQFFSSDDGEGVLLSYPSQTVMWDVALYPGSTDVLLPSASTPTAADNLLAYVREHFSADTPMVFKFSDVLTRDIFVEAFDLQFANRYLSYTSDQPFEWPELVTRATDLQDDCAELFIRNGYTRDELEKYFADGAVSYRIDQRGILVCACLIYRNYDTIWEIGGVHTVESARRQGVAQQVVKAALHDLILHGRIPRYQASATNISSIKLAESLGMRVCLNFEHYTTPSR